MNKKFLALALAAAVSVSVFVTGCNQEQQQTEPTAPTYVGVDDDFFDGMETATQPEKPSGATTATDPTEEASGDETEPAQTTPTQTETTAPTGQSDPAGGTTFAEYLAMTGDEQRAFAKTFPSMDDFFLWYDEKAEEAGQKDVIEVTGPIDLGQFEN